MKNKIKQLTEQDKAAIKENAGHLNMRQIGLLINASRVCVHSYARKNKIYMGIDKVKTEAELNFDKETGLFNEADYLKTLIY